MPTKMKRSHTPWDNDQRLAVWILYQPGHFQLVPPRPALRAAAFNALFRESHPLGRNQALLNNEWYRLKYSSPRPFPLIWQDLTASQRAVCEKLRAVVNDDSNVLEHDAGNTIPTATSDMPQSAMYPTSPRARRTATASQISYDEASDDEIALASPTPKRRRTQCVLSAVEIPACESQERVSDTQLHRQPLTPPETPRHEQRRSSTTPTSLPLPDLQFMVIRTCGPALWLKRRALEEYHLPLEDVAEADAFPPAPALLFR